MANHAKELAGKTFGDVLVIERAGRSARGAILWRCRCGRCGREFVEDGAHFGGKNGKLDCGCRYRERTRDLTGETIGGLRVLERLPERSKSGDAMYRCECLVCGRVKDFPACTVRAVAKSCGCILRSYQERIGEQATEAAQAGVVNGVGVSNALRAEPNHNNKLGIRGIHYSERRGYYIAQCQVGGEKWASTYATLSDAIAAYESNHKRLLDKYRVPRRGKEKI